MTLTLHRIYLATATLGILELETGERFATLEDPAGVGKGCIGEGDYELEPHTGPAYNDAWALVGPDVSHYPAPGVKWSTVLLHVGNTIEDTRGCVLVANKIDVRAARIVESALGVSRLLGCLRAESRHRLKIQRG